MLRISLLAVLISGCVSTEQYKWVYGGPPIENRITVIIADPTSYCTQFLGPPPPGWLYEGCSVRDYSKWLCTRYFPPAVAPWVIEHEDKHCDGFNHPKEI